MSYRYRSFHVYAQDVHSHVVAYVHSTSCPDLASMFTVMQQTDASAGRLIYANGFGQQPASVTERWAITGNYCGVGANAMLYVSFNGEPECTFHVWMEPNHDYETDAHPSTWGVAPELWESLRV